MANLKEEFEAEVVAAVQRLRGQSHPQSFVGRDTTVRGWEIGYEGSRGPFRDGPWEENASVYLILAEDGTIWERVDTSRELHQSPWTFERHDSLWQMQAQVLVGQKGKPFSEWKARIERAGY